MIEQRATITEHIEDLTYVNHLLLAAAISDHVVVGYHAKGERAYFDVSPDQEVTAYSIKGPHAHTVAVKGLQMVGIQRRRRREPKILAVAPTELQDGDRLVLERPNRQRQTTKRVQRFSNETALMHHWKSSR